MSKSFQTAPENDVRSPGRPVAVRMDDLLVLFLTKARVGTPYVPLAYQFSLTETPTRRNILRARNVFNATVGKRLFHLHHAKCVRAHLPDDWPDRFKDTLLIGDGYPKSIMKSGTFIIQRITWSVYKHDNIFLVVICKCVSVLGITLSS